jgi:hypothetical protein
LPGSSANSGVDALEISRFGGRDDTCSLPRQADGREAPATLTEIRKLGRTLKQRATDILAFFDRPGTSNGPTEARDGAWVDSPRRRANQPSGSRLARNRSGGDGPHRCGGTSQSPATQHESTWSMSLNHSIQLPHGSGL